MKTIKTRIHTYAFNTGNAADKAVYDKLHELLRADGNNRDFFNAIDTGKDKYPLADNTSEEIELETEILFNNQWNSAPTEKSAKGWRVFDWYEGINYSAGVKSKYVHGHWLEITDEMREIRANTLKCGYCAKQYDRREYTGEFCNSCLDSEYLKEEDLHLLRLFTLDMHRPKYPELNEAERAYLVPRYTEQQTQANGSRAVARRDRVRQQIEDKYRRETENARTEHDGMVWLLDHGVNVDNCIYYGHLQTFSFGWRTPVSEDVRARLLQILGDGTRDEDFKHKYEIKCEVSKSNVRVVSQ